MQLNQKILAILTLACLVGWGSQLNADIIEQYDFDGTIGYNLDSTTATASGDWVDFANRIQTSDISPGIEGFTIANGGTETVLAGAAVSGDPQIRSDFNTNIDASTLTNVQLRIRVDVDDNGVFDDTLALGNISLFFGTSTYGTPGAGNVGGTNINFNTVAAPVLTAQSNGWTLVDWEFNAGAIASPIQSLRIDPVNSPGSSFEVDYLSFSAVPEPGSLAVLTVVGIGMLVRRSRRAA